jgi:predicted nucleic acid-binding protein
VAVVLDSNAVIGFLDEDDALHRAADAKIRELLGRERLIVSVVTYAEVLTGAKLGPHSEEHVSAFFADLISEVIAVDVPVAEQAADFRARLESLRMPDALILATAEVDPDVDLVVSGDERATTLPGLSFGVALLQPSDTG